MAKDRQGRRKKVGLSLEERRTVILKFGRYNWDLIVMAAERSGQSPSDYIRLGAVAQALIDTHPSRTGDTP